MTELVVTRGYFYRGSGAIRIIQWIIGLIQFALVVRFILEFLGANSSSEFVAWVYSATQGLVAPFTGAFPSLFFGGYVIDLSIIFAIIGYIIIGYLLTQLVSFVFSAMNNI